MSSPSLRIVVIGLFFLSTAVFAHNRVVVVPLGGGDFKYQNPLVIPAEVFWEENTSGEVIYRGGYWDGVTGGQLGCLNAPVYLPDGVTLTRVEAVVYDSDQSVNLTTVLSRAINTVSNAANQRTMASFATTGRSFDFQRISDTTILEPVIDNTTKSYRVSTCLFNSNMRLVSMRIYFNQ